MISAKTIPSLPQGVHRYERGLYVRVTKTSRSWIYKYQLGGKRHELGLGPAIGQPISAVLAKVSAMKALVAQGVDPKEKIEHNKAEQRTAKAKEKMPTFSEFVPHALERIFFLRSFVGKNTEPAWRNDATVLTDAFGRMRIDEIHRDDVAAFLRPLWASRPRRARDLLSRLRGILNVAKGEELIAQNPAEWKGCLDAVLPSASLVARSRPANHHAALSPEDLREVVQALWKKDNVTALAVVFGALSAGRANEYLAGLWEEVDLVEKTFSVPQARRKDKKPDPHVVPLSRQMLTLLGRLDTSGDFVFASASAEKPISQTGAREALRQATDKPVTLHGMRSTFSDWCAKNEKNFLVSEKQLMHSVGNSVFRAYQRDDLLAQRRKLMQEWADFLLPDA